MKTKTTIKDAGLRGSFAALRRASKVARRRSRTLGTAFYVMKDGKIVDLNRVKPKGKSR